MEKTKQTEHHIRTFPMHLSRCGLFKPVSGGGGDEKDALIELYGHVLSADSFDLNTDGISYGNSSAEMN